MKYHFLYKTINLINNKIYIGKHTTSNIFDGYMGSGDRLNRARLKYGDENFYREILRFYKSEYDVFEIEKLIVNKQFVNRRDTYNLTIGGYGSWNHINNTDKVIVKDKNGNTMQISVNDPRFLSGELVGITKGCLRPGLNKGKVTVKDKSGNTMSVSVDDARYKSGELVGIMKGRKIINRKKYDLIKCPWCNKEGTGGIRSHHFDYCKENPNRKIRKIRIIKYKQLTCPHCRKEGKGPSMKRWHFDNCKSKPH